MVDFIELAKVIKAEFKSIILKLKDLMKAQLINVVDKDVFIHHLHI